MKTKKRIGLIAMSGVRAHNEELTALGLTLPGFVERNKVIASLPSLGLLTLAGLTPERFEVEYHEIADLKSTRRNCPPISTWWRLSTFTAQFYEACRVADFYQAKEIPVVMGGITVSVPARRGQGTLHQRGHRRRRTALAASVGRFRARRTSSRFTRAARRNLICRRADATIRFARPGQIQPPHRPNQPRLPASLRVLRQFDPVDLRVTR